MALIYPPRLGSRKEVIMANWVMYYCHEKELQNGEDLHNVKVQATELPNTWMTEELDARRIWHDEYKPAQNALRFLGSERVPPDYYNMSYPEHRDRVRELRRKFGPSPRYGLPEIGFEVFREKEHGKKINADAAMDAVRAMAEGSGAFAK